MIKDYELLKVSSLALAKAVAKLPDYVDSKGIKATLKRRYCKGKIFIVLDIPEGSFNYRCICHAPNQEGHGQVVFIPQPLAYKVKLHDMPKFD